MDSRVQSLSALDPDYGSGWLIDLAGVLLFHWCIGGGLTNSCGEMNLQVERVDEDYFQMKDN